MCPVDFIKLPVMAIRVDDSCVLYLRIDFAHVLKTPEPSTHGLGQGHFFANELRLKLFVLDGEENRDQGEPNAVLIVTCSP